MEQTSTTLIPQERIESKILLIRKYRIMLDRDLAYLYGVETRSLNQAVRRNRKRFPKDFMFQLTKEEMENWKSQIVISNFDKMGLRHRPFAFTEHGILMLSSVLSSERAIEVNIQIMRAFTKMRQILAGQEAIWKKIEEIEQKHGKRLDQHDSKIHFYSTVLDGLLSDVEYINKLLTPPEEPEQRQIGFRDRNQG